MGNKWGKSEDCNMEAHHFHHAVLIIKYESCSDNLWHFGAGQEISTGQTASPSSRNYVDILIWGSLPYEEMLFINISGQC